MITFDNDNIFYQSRAFPLVSYIVMLKVLQLALPTYLRCARSKREAPRQMPLGKQPELVAPRTLNGLAIC